MSSKVVICGVNTSSLPTVSEEQAFTLLTAIKGGDEVARENFIVANMRLVLSVIKRFWAKKISCDDVFQAGVIGLIKAIDNFDLSFGVRFSTYAVPMIMGEIKKYLRDGNSMRVARSIRDTAYLALKTRAELEKEEEHVSLSMVAKVMKIAEEEVVYALDAISDTVSLYDPVFNKEGDTLTIVDQLRDEKNNEENWTEKVALESALSSLDERERNIIRLRYYEGKTQTEISQSVGISQAQVSRIEKNALKEIKRFLTI